MNATKINKVFKKAISSKDIYDLTLLVEKSNGEIVFSGEHGSKTIHSLIALASISKLFTTACILMLLEKGKLALQDNISKYIDRNLLRGIHHYKGKDYSDQVTIEHLLFQTSGLPDIYEEGKERLINRIIIEDFDLPINEFIARTKEKSSYFSPHDKKRSHYSVINFELLGLIIEKVTGTSYEEACKAFIFDPLNLKSTYFVTSTSNITPDIYYKSKKINRPKYLSCVKPSGGAISTTHELMIFIKAFFDGSLFNKALFSQLNTYYRLQSAMFPIQYGGGFMRIPLKNIFSLYLGHGELLGHSGSTGSFAFYCPHRDLFIVGDINQMTKRALPIQMLMQIVFGR